MAEDKPKGGIQEKAKRIAGNLVENGLEVLRRDDLREAAKAGGRAIAAAIDTDIVEKRTADAVADDYVEPPAAQLARLRVKLKDGNLGIPTRCSACGAPARWAATEMGVGILLQAGTAVDGNGTVAAGDAHRAHCRGARS